MKFRFKKVKTKKGDAIVTADAEKRIRKSARVGAQTLDKVFPKWFKQQYIALKDLELADAQCCVYGQLSNAAYDHKMDLADADVITKALVKAGVPTSVSRPDGLDITDASDLFGGIMHEEAVGYTYDEQSWDVLNDLHEELEAKGLTVKLYKETAAFAVLQDEWEKQIRARREKAKA